MNDPRLPPNLRDVGGLRTARGARIVGGRLFRSSHGGSLDEAALAAVATLGLRTAVDLRGVQERASAPNRWAIPDDGDLHLPIEPQAVAGLMARLAAGESETAAARGAMTDAYRRFVTEHASVFGTLLARLTQPASYPLLFHCTAGKDRTGFACALVLLALEVPRETVVADFLASNGRWRPNSGTMASRLLAEVRVEYLDAALGEIEAGWGSVPRFLERRLGFDTHALERLRGCLLER